MKLATWNVNSLKVRLPQVLEWAGRHRPDVLCLQETKVEDSKFPLSEIEAAGYRAAFSGQKTYNGVAILSRAPGTEVVTTMPALADEQKRVLAATIEGTRVVCLYVPNGESVSSEKYQYKLRWLAAAREWLGKELTLNPRMAVLGDFNIAPEARDVHDPQLWEGKVLFSEPERAALRELTALPLHDSFRLFDQPDRSFTWWDYRMNGFRRKLGLRIDHILLSDALMKQCASCVIDVEPRGAERPSDHAPVIAELKI